MADLLGPYSYAPPSDDDISSDENIKLGLGGLLSPVDAQTIVNPPPTSAPKTGAGQTTPQTGTLATAPSQSQPKVSGAPMIPGVATKPESLAATYAAQQQAYAARPQAGAAPAMPASLGSIPGYSAKTPSLPATASTQVNGPTQLDKDQSRLDYLKNSGSGLDQVKNPWLRTLGRVADVAGTVLTPGLAEAIPGTTLHHRELLGRQAGLVSNDQQQQQQAAQLADTQSQKTQRDAQAAREAAQAAGTAPVMVTPEMHTANPSLVVGTQIRPADYGKTLSQQTRNAGLIKKQQDAIAAQAAKSGQTVTFDADGTPTFKDDPTSGAYKAQQALQAYRQGMEEAAALKAKLAQDKVTPGTPAWNMAQQQLSSQNLRNESYYGRYLLAAKGTDLHGNDLPGQTRITDDNGNTTGVGTAFQKQATTQQNRVSQFNDVLGATDNIEKTATDLVKSGGKLNDPAVASAIADPSSTAAQWLQGEVVNSNLTPAQIKYVASIKAYRENLQVLRASGISDQQVNRLEVMAPGAATPNLDVLKTQTGQIRQTAGRLAEGITTVKGGHTVRTDANAPNGNNSILIRKGNGQPISQQTAQQYLQKFGGDPAKARTAAQKDGWKF